MENRMEGPQNTGGSDGEASAYNAGDLGSIPGLGKIPWRRKMATHSSILAWRIPWTEEPGGLHNPWGRKYLTRVSS